MDHFCNSCEFYEQSSATTKDGQKVGFCHLNPPLPIYNHEETQIVHALPLTYSDWWCAAYERAEFVEVGSEH